MIVGERGDSDTDALLAEAYRHYIPNRVLLGARGVETEADGMPLLADRRKVDGLPTAYLCENYVCQLPVTDPMAFARQLVD